MPTLRRVALVALPALALLACGGGSSPTSPEPPTLTGSWAGSYVVTVGGSNSGAAAFQLTQAGSAVSGTATLDAGTSVASSGVVVGGLSGSGLTMDFIPSTPGLCPIRFNGTWTGNSIRGQWVAFNCTASFGGTLELRR